MNRSEAVQGASGFMAALLFSLLVVSLLDSYNTLFFILFFAQGYFFASYALRLLSREEGSGPLFAYAGILGLLVLAFALISPGMNIVMTAAAGLFALAFFLAELRIAGLPLTFERALLCAGMIVAFTVIFLRGRFGVEWDVSVAAIIALLTLPYALRAWHSRTLPASDMLFILASTIPALLFVFQFHVDMTSSLAFLLIFYSTRQYIHVFFNELKKGRTAARRYLRAVLVVNALVLLGYCLYIYGTFAPFSYVFARDPFYFWVILHALFVLGSMKLASRSL